MTALFSPADLLTAQTSQPPRIQQPFNPVRLSTDTRTLEVGDFFIPLSGANFDGHDYLQQAFEQGVTGAFVQREKLAAHPEWQDLPNLIPVADPVQAYLDMASLYRRRINPRVIAVTGSSGKTTTKEMLSAALSPLARVMKTAQNFNNEIGVAQTLLALEPGTDILIVEMGMRGLNQIRPLSLAARPDIALIVNAGSAHIGLLGSRDAIAQAKLEIVDGLDPNTGYLVYCADCPELHAQAPQRWHGPMTAYCLENVQPWIPVTEDGGSRFQYKGRTISLAVSGAHMISNAVGVLTVGEGLGYPVEALLSGLSAFQPPDGRGDYSVLDAGRDITVINDAYNANPESVQASITAFLAAAGLSPARRHVLVLAGMKELGDQSQVCHEALGAWLATQSHINALILLGEEAPWMLAGMQQAGRVNAFPVRVSDKLEKVPDLLNAMLPHWEHTTLYLKGSRAYRLNELPELIQTYLNRIPA